MRHEGAFLNKNKIGYYIKAKKVSPGGKIPGS